MRKRVLKKYLNTNKDKINYVYDYEDKYILTNTYSILVLNDIENISKMSEDLKVNEYLLKSIEDFKTYEDYGTRIDLENYNENNIKEYKNEQYGVNKSMLENIVAILGKVDTIKVLEKWKNTFWTIVIYIENKDTNEHCYLLPTRVI